MQVLKYWRLFLRAKSAVGVPRWIIENADNFKYLLPGGCMRETPLKIEEEKEEKKEREGKDDLHVVIAWAI